jgi:16S rRNA (cytosine967-C5)-methyltransferase
MIQKTTARAGVLELLLRCEAAGQYANIALDTALNRSGLQDADRALFTALFYGVIEHRITLDHIIDRLASMSPSGIERRVRMLLRLGLCQLLYFDRIPDHAAIYETVALTPGRSKGFVNALLRRFCREGKRICAPDRDEDLIGYLSVTYSVPTELAECFCRIWGTQDAEQELAALSLVPKTTVRVNTNRLTREEWIARFGGEPTRYAPHGVRFSDGAVLRDALAAGLCFVQDEASQICVAALDAKGQDVLDVCAAPGSKSFGAALDGAARVCSYDLHDNKLSLIRRGAQVLGIDNLCADARDARTASPETVGCFSRVLADVPCSGFGVLAKKPDIRHRAMDGTEALCRTQRAILDTASHYVKAGGTLCYSTCTLNPMENEEAVREFLSCHSEFEATDFTLGPICSKNGMYTFFPGPISTDGFFVALMKRK